MQQSDNEIDGTRIEVYRERGQFAPKDVEAGPAAYGVAVLLEDWLEVVELQIHGPAGQGERS